MSEHKEETARFIHAYEQPDGGFSFSQSTPSTLEDTFYAVTTLQALGERTTNHQIKDFLSSIPLTPDTSPRHLWMLARLGASLQLRRLTKIAADTAILRARHPQPSESIVYLLLTLEATGKTASLTPIKPRKEMLLSTPDSVSNAVEHIVLHHLTGNPLKKAQYATYLVTAQNPDGGFGPLPKTTSFIEYTHLALLGLSLLGRRSRKTKQCEQFVHLCRSTDGGYGRQIDALPTIEATYCAVQILLNLSKHHQNHLNLL